MGSHKVEQLERALITKHGVVERQRISTRKSPKQPFVRVTMYFRL